MNSLSLVAAFIASATAQCAINSAATQLIQGYEQFRADPYNDGSGYWTVGYGHRCVPNEQSCPDVQWPLTESAAQALFRKDIATYESCLTNDLTVCLNDNQYGALVSWTYNVGCGNAGGSTLVKDLNQDEDPDTVAQQQLPQWDKSGGKVSTGLQRRRQAELNLFQQASSASGNCCSGGGGGSGTSGGSGQNSGGSGDPGQQSGSGSASGTGASQSNGGGSQGGGSQGGGSQGGGSQGGGSQGGGGNSGNSGNSGTSAKKRFFRA